MALLVALEHHFVRTKDGVYTDLAFAYDYWQEYLEVFDEIIVTARVENSPEEPDGMLRADGEGVRFFDIVNYRGGSSFIKNAPKVFWQARKAIREANAYLLRAGNVGAIVWFWLMLKCKRYAMEYMGHVKEGLVTERPKTVFYKIISGMTHAICKLQVRFAQCSSYTSEFLRRTYPCRKREIEYVFSGVRLTDAVITAARPKSSFDKTPFKLVSIGRVELQKGHAWLVESAAELAKRRDLPDWQLDIVGPGSQVPVLKERIKELGVEDKVSVVGGVAWGDELFGYIDKSQLFVLPSLTEGMPRSLIEAMARGIPAIGADTGGIPELLEKEDLVDVGDVEALADKIAQCMVDSDKLVEMSKRNFAKAQEYRIEKTKAEKMSFWRKIYETGN